MLTKLIKIQLKGLFQSLFTFSVGKKKKRNPILNLLIILLVIYVISAIGLSIGLLFYQMGIQMIPQGYSLLYFVDVGFMAAGASLVFSAFTSQSLLFEAKDNELLLSLPIKPSKILGSRILVLSVINAVVHFIILFSAAAIYIHFKHPGISFYVVFIISLLLMILFSVALSCIFGYLLSVITVRMRNKAIFVTMISVVLLLIFLYFYINISLNVNNLIAEGSKITEAVKIVLPPFYHYSSLLISPNITSFIVLAAWCIISFAAIYALLSKHFITLVTTKRQFKKIVYRQKDVKSKSVFYALLKKESGKFFSTPPYMLNCGFAFIMEILFAGFFFVKGKDALNLIFDKMPQATGLLVPVIVAYLAFTAGMGCTTSPSISLEGKQLWIIKSSPIDIKTLFHAKISLNLILGISCLMVSDLLIFYVLKPSLSEALLIIGIPIALQIFTALIGLLCNLLFPKLDFMNETLVIKQSVSTLISIFSSIVLVGILSMLYINVFQTRITFIVYGSIVFAAVMGINSFLYYIIRTKGVTLFQNI